MNTTKTTSFIPLNGVGYLSNLVIILYHKPYFDPTH